MTAATIRNDNVSPDLYGQVHPTETPELIKKKLEELQEEIDKLHDKQGLDEAMEKCPDLVNELRLAFLRCDVFHVQLAAKRMACYWQKRIELFGRTKAFLPLTLHEALRDDAVAVKHGFVRLVHSRDPCGRGILFVDPSRQDRSCYPRESMVRAFWYMLHAALEQESSQRNGFVFVASLQKAKLSEFDQQLLKLGAESLQGCIPIRASAFHICHPPMFFNLVYPIFKLLMGPRLRKRIIVHSTWQQDEPLASLQRYGLEPNMLPTEVGGKVELKHEGWISKQREDNL